MPEYHVSFKKVATAAGADVHAQVSDDDEVLIHAVEAIRSRIVEYSGNMRNGLDALPNGHFMEIEFLVEDESVRGVVFMTPYLPDAFVTVVRKALAGVDVENVV